jgi:uncharacterized protein
VPAIDGEMDRDIIHAGTVDETLRGSRCFICYGDPFEIGDSVVKLRCQCPYWAYEECMSRCVVEYTECPTCRVPVTSLDPKCILLDAASRGDLSKVRELLDKGIFHSPRGALEDTPLMRTAQKGHKEVTVALLEQGALVSDRQVRGSTALHLAVAGGRSEMVTLLLDHGADISAVDKKHRSLLHYAIGRQPNQEVVQLLLNRGGPCSIPDQDCLAPLDLAEKGRHEALVHLLRSRGAIWGFQSLIKGIEEFRKPKWH